MVHLKNCQNYTQGLCRKLVVNSVCELGGTVAYLPERGSKMHETNAINFQISAAIYIADAAIGDDDFAEGRCVEPPPEDTDPDAGDCVE